VNVVLPKITEPLTSEQLRRRVLAILNGAPTSVELREAAGRAALGALVDDEEGSA
jgi:hypothetical protein